jgi:hypothetical protein
MNNNYELSIPTGKVTENKNPLVSTEGFKMVFARAPNVEYFLQSFSIPSISVPEVPINRGPGRVYAAGDMIVFDPLTVTMLVSEDMDNFTEMYDWLHRLVTSNTIQEKFDDLTIYIMSSKSNPNKTLTFYNVFPTTMGNISFSSLDGDVVYATLDVTFRYDRFTIA